MKTFRNVVIAALFALAPLTVTASADPLENRLVFSCETDIAARDLAADFHQLLRVRSIPELDSGLANVPVAVWIRDCTEVGVESIPYDMWDARNEVKREAYVKGARALEIRIREVGGQYFVALAFDFDALLDAAQMAEARMTR